MVDPPILKNRITRIIAATRFPFVDQETWSNDFVTIVNDETKRYGVKWEEGVLYPSIVIAFPDGSIREFGSVEAAEDISDESVERWRALSDVVPYGRAHKKLFLYVPEGYEDKTLRLLEENGWGPIGLWAEAGGLGPSSFKVEVRAFGRRAVALWPWS